MSVQGEIFFFETYLEILLIFYYKMNRFMQKELQSKFYKNELNVFSYEFSVFTSISAKIVSVQ